MLPFSIDLLLSVVIALIMFGIGASLRFADFGRIFSNPKGLLLGLSLQMVMLPLLVGILVALIPMPAAFKVGFIVLSLCPGGATSNFISYLLRLETALSISLTSINTVLILATIPLGTSLALELFYHSGSPITLPVGDTMVNVFLVVLLPALAGVAFNPSTAVEPVLKVVNIVLLAAVFGVKFFADERTGGSGLGLQEILFLLPIALAIHLITMIGSFFVSKKVLNSLSNATTIGIEVGLQNTTLALMITATLLNNNPMSQPILVYALFSFFTTLIFGFIARNDGKIRWELPAIK